MAGHKTGHACRRVAHALLDHDATLCQTQNREPHDQRPRSRLYRLIRCDRAFLPFCEGGPCSNSLHQPPKLIFPNTIAQLRGGRQWLHAPQ